MQGKDNSRRISPVVILSLLLLIILGLTATKILETRRSKMPPLQPEVVIPGRLSRRGLTRDLAATIVAMFDKRADALVEGKPGSIDDIYSPSRGRDEGSPAVEGTPSGGNHGENGNGESEGGAGSCGDNKALQHEMRRIRYVTAWAAKRGVRFTGSDVYLQIHDMEARGDVILLNVWQSLNLKYTYAETREARTGAAAAVEAAARGKQRGSGAFGIRTRHTLELVRAANGKWLILKDEYTDPLGEDTLVPEVAPAMMPAPTAASSAASAPGTTPAPATSLAMAISPMGATLSAPAWNQGRSGSYDRRYDRRAAVAYANKYCGVKTGAKAREGKEFGYNPRYKDYTDLGGDCTNFISQVLGDREGGRLPMDDVWYYDFSAGDGGKGSSAWTETEAFRDYLLGSGIAKCLARGDYYGVTRQTKKFPRGVINELREGDLIAYEEKGDIQHFAVVVGRDSAGYTLVNSHTADRYRVPWDLGWDRKTIFWLLKIL